ncbi:hypothetical protein AB1286_12630 [Trinickia sp. NRRL B-1857]|uniref:hypothetical protein n=1 Tax=Trinickia sp. NRRL B-1857 TaxID=3162879 RepID=UPI003D2699C9
MIDSSKYTLDADRQCPSWLRSAYDDLCGAVRGEPHTELIPVEDACMRVTAEDVKAPGPVPRVPYTLRRGYAVRAADTAGASRAHPVELEKNCGGLRNFIETGGDPAASALERGQCEYLPAGIPLPEDADAVLYTPPVETDEVTLPIESTLKVTAPVSKGDNARLAGQDYERGATLVARGTRITPQIQAVLIAAGVFTVPVYRSPRVGVVLSSYDAVPPANVEHAWQQPDSMSAYVRSMFARWGYVMPSVELLTPLPPTDSPNTAHDAQEVYRDRLLDLMSAYDLLIGVGMPVDGTMLGNGLGGPVSCFPHGQERVHFDNTKDRGFICGLGDDRTSPVLGKHPYYQPDSPNEIFRYDGFYIYDRAIVFNVPGQTPEVGAVMHLFIRRILDSMEYVAHPGPVWRRGTLASPLTRHGKEHRFIWGVARTDEKGRVVIEARDDQNSQSLRSFAVSNVLVAIRSGADSLAAGECVDYLLLE